jgi:hypothetical protein
LIWVVLKFIRFYRAVEEFELFIRVGTWLGPAGLKAKLDGLTAAIKSLEDERYDPAIPLQDTSPGSSQRQLQNGTARADSHGPAITPQPTHSENASARNVRPVEDNNYSYPLPGERNFGSYRSGRNDQLDDDESPQSSQATGSGVPRSPPRRRTSLLADPRSGGV